MSKKNKTPTEHTEAALLAAPRVLRFEWVPRAAGYGMAAVEDLAGQLRPDGWRLLQILSEERSVNEEITDSHRRGGVGPGTIRRAGYLLVFER